MYIVKTKDCKNTQLKLQRTGYVSGEKICSLFYQRRNTKPVYRPATYLDFKMDIEKKTKLFADVF